MPLKDQVQDQVQEQAQDEGHHQADRYWRVVATAVAFLTFGLGGVLLWLCYFPLLQLLVRDRHRKMRYARRTVHYTFKAFIGLLRVLGVLRYRIEGVDKLKRSGLLILANHPTLIDVIFLIALVPNANCVVKAKLARNLFTRGPVLATGYVINNAGAELIDDCIASLNAGDNLVIFPEGTRTAVDGVLRLQRGAANIAIRGARDITPVTIRCVPLSLTKGLPWWKVPSRRMQFCIEVHEDIAAAPFIEQTTGSALAARALTRYLYDYFSRETETHAAT